MSEEKKTEEQQKNQQKLLKPPWLDIRLTKEVMDHLWDMINQQGTQPAAGSVMQKDANFAGPNNKVKEFEDKNDWFFENALKKCSEQLYYKDWSNYYNTYITKIVPSPVFELGRMWVNHQKQHEYIPPHNHNSGIGFSFVVFMKIPTHWKEQYALPWLKDVEHSHASDFQFLLAQGQTQVEPIAIPLCPEDEGRMLFFPSWLTHQVFPFYNCDKERITLSGNILKKATATSPSGQHESISK